MQNQQTLTAKLAQARQQLKKAQQRVAALESQLDKSRALKPKGEPSASLPAQQQLPASEKMLQLVLDTIPVRVFWKNRNSVTLGCNRLFALDAGFDSTTELLGKSHHELAPVAIEAPQYRTDDLMVMETGVAKLEYEETLTLPGHGVLKVQTSKLPLRDDAGEVIGLLGVYSDITRRKQVEAALVESEARYRLLAENVIDMITEMGLDGIRTFVTPSCTALLGYTPEELIGRAHVDIVHPEDRATMQATIAQAIAEQKPSFTLTQRVQHKAGHYLWVEETNSVIYHTILESDLEIIGVMRDINDRKMAEELLNKRIAEEQAFQHALKILHEITIELTPIEQLDLFYRRVVELGRLRLGFERLALFLYDGKADMVQGTYGTDDQGATSDERHLRFKPSYTGIMLRAFESAERFCYVEHSPLYNDGEPISAGWNAAAALWNGKQRQGWLVADSLLQQKPATKALLDILGLYALTVGTLLAQKQVQLALRGSEARYRLLTELVSDVVVRTNAAAEFIYVSPSVQQLLGYSPDELLAKPMFGFIHSDHLPDLQETLNQVRNAQEQIPYYTLQARHKDGHYLWLEANSRAIFDETTGELLEVISSARDITERKRAADALQESEERFRRAIVNAPFPIMIHAEDGTVLHVNTIWSALSGYLEAELPTLTDWTVRAYRQNQQTTVPDQEIGQAHQQPLSHGEMQIWTKSGEMRIWDFVSAIIGRLPDGSPLYSTMAADLTAHKRMDAELEKQRSFLENIINISPSLIFVKDYNGRFVLVNRMVAKLYNNTTAEAMIGKTDADFNPNQQEVDHFLASDRQVIDTGEPLFIEEPVTNHTGETRWLQTTKVPLVSADGKTKYVLGLSTDFTERKHAEEALQESEIKYRSLVETMRGGLLISDKEARITYVNDRFCEMLGAEREQFVGQIAYENLEGAHAQNVEMHLKNRQKAESSTYEIVVTHQDGHPVHLLVAGSPLFDKRGTYHGSVAVFTDITRQKQAEEALRQALAREKELGELKSRFVSMASHEFRTPLAAILTITETLIAYRQKLPEEQITQRLDRIRVQIGHLRSIMDDVLLLARMQARRFEFNPIKLNPDTLCRSILEEFQSRALTHQVHYQCQAADDEFLLDPKLLRQIISNLIANAIKYSPADKPIWVNLAFVANLLTFSVSDKGIGIPEADLKHLFEPFHRGSNVGTISGTGLGLVITKESVELHGGAMTVQSQIGEGTTFMVTIPIVAGM